MTVGNINLIVHLSILIIVINKINNFVGSDCYILNKPASTERSKLSVNSTSLIPPR